MNNKTDSTHADDEVDIRDQFREHLEMMKEKYGTPLTFIINKTGIPYHRLYASVYLKRYNMSEADRQILNEVLETDF